MSEEENAKRLLQISVGNAYISNLKNYLLGDYTPPIFRVKYCRNWWWPHGNKAMIRE